MIHNTSKQRLWIATALRDSDQSCGSLLGEKSPNTPLGKSRLKKERSEIMQMEIVKRNTEEEKKRLAKYQEELKKKKERKEENRNAGK